MSDKLRDETRKAGRIFPSLLKDLDQLTLEELSRDMKEFESIQYSKLSNGRDKERDMIGDAIYGKLEQKLLEEITPIIKRYKLVYSKSSSRRWLSIKASDKIKVGLYVLETGMELHPEILFNNDENYLQIHFPANPSDSPYEYKTFAFIDYKSLEKSMYDKLEPIIDAVNLTKAEIKNYPENSLVGYKSEKYRMFVGRLFGKYDVGGYIVGKGFVIVGSGNLVVTKDDTVEKAWK